MNRSRNLLAALFLLLAAPALNAGFEHFITVEGTSLKDGEADFRFISFNVPTLFYVEDEMAFDVTNPYGLPTEFELRDLFQTVVDMGGRVVRAYTIPVRNRNFPAESVTYVEAPGEFNEEAFRAMDLALALAQEYGIRVIVPLVNNWQWMGGRPDYAAFRGKGEDDFWSDRQLIDDFKKTIGFVLNRSNTVTGVKYRDDKTILAWETGNELQNTPEWALEIGAYIKSIDSNHLLIDGFHAIHSEGHDVWVQDYSMTSPHFDLVNTHHYEPTSMDTVRNLKKTVEMTGRQKPLFLGEFGFISTSGVEEVLDYVIGEPAIPGALLWSLRRHHEGGGFYHHTEPIGYGLYRAYHWPGFDDGEKYDERRLMRLVREKAFEIQGKAAPPLRAPQPPQVIPFEKAPVFSWRGSAGAAGYDIERSEGPEGPWIKVAWDVDDIDTPGFPLFSDTSAKTGTAYRYRVIARNAAGESAPSEPFGPVEIGHLTRVDKARNVGVLQDSKGVEVRSGDHRSFKEAFSRLHGGAGAWLVYSAPGRLLDIRVYAYEASRGAGPAQPALTLEVSPDAAGWEAKTPVVRAYPSSEKNYDYRVPVEYRLALDAGTKYVRATFRDEADIVRVELDYRPGAAESGNLE
jgi:hypothetical protein